MTSIDSAEWVVSSTIDLFEQTIITLWEDKRLWNVLAWYTFRNTIGLLLNQLILESHDVKGRRNRHGLWSFQINVWNYIDHPFWIVVLKGITQSVIFEWRWLIFEFKYFWSDLKSECWLLKREWVKEIENLSRADKIKHR